MTSTQSEDVRSKSDQACQSGEEFINIYYDVFDKRRQALLKLYMLKATLVWNGSQVTGSDNIVKFFEALPSSEHTVESIDCQPLRDVVTHGQTSILVTASGIVKFDVHKVKAFNHSFMLTTETVGDQQVSWKIASDCVRFCT